MRRPASVLAVAGVLLLTVTGPVRAGDVHRGDPVSAAFPDVDVPVGGTAIDPLGPSLWSTIGPTTLTGVRVAYALSGVAGVRITPSGQGGGDCTTPSATRVVCTDPRGLSFEGETVEMYLPVVVRATGSAEPGTTGKVTVTVSADGLAPITGTSRVHVVDRRVNLPVTGPSAAWIGGLMLVLGVITVVATRRRPVQPPKGSRTAADTGVPVSSGKKSSPLRVF
ncbi:hypothetical protein [Actinoplanes xinjiangensis]|uniref:LPXTG-motif cell wall-anchored protein n=1 Tax=Actinoplanes xinjiangensis TaxID=512350 RepID=A0A316FGX8_9ACTN|nr:hypothetical protein [Actinoplanes xinjiangensis]PWK47030.1 hypothetical protein BC793_108144 [Actinoplanes xinjiangensis]GIF40190.1 hypothetical protein Axi01nite_45010 [Actinoplanes xinjiangensis]